MLTYDPMPHVSSADGICRRQRYLVLTPDEQDNLHAIGRFASSHPIGNKSPTAFANDNRPVRGSFPPAVVSGQRR